MHALNLLFLFEIPLVHDPVRTQIFSLFTWNRHFFIKTLGIFSLLTFTILPIFFFLPRTISASSFASHIISNNLKNNIILLLWICLPLIYMFINRPFRRITSGSVLDLLFQTIFPNFLTLVTFLSDDAMCLCVCVIIGSLLRPRELLTSKCLLSN